MTHRSNALVALLLLTALTYSHSCLAQGYRGNDFWIAFPKNARIEKNYRMEFSIFIAAERRAVGRIEFSNGAAPINFGVEGGASTSIPIDTTIEITRTGVPESKAVHIIANQDVTVYVLSHRSASTDSYAAIPTSLLGTRYVVAGYRPLSNSSFGFSTQAVAIATQDQTEISIRLSDSISVSAEPAEVYPSGRTLTFFLNRGQTLRLSSEHVRGGQDLSGSVVTASKPIAFLTGHSCAQVPSDVSFCDMLLEMEPPADKFGTDFLVPAFAEKRSYVTRVFASDDSTSVQSGDSTVAVLASGSYWESPRLMQDVRIRTSKPALVLQYATSAQADRPAVGDPFVLSITPHDRFITEATAVTLAEGQWNHYLAIVTDSENVGELRIDGVIPDSRALDGAVYKQPSQFQSMMRVTKTSDTLVGSRTLRSTIPGVDYVLVTQPDVPSEESADETPVGRGPATQRFSVVRWQITSGRHLIQSSKPFAIYEYGFGGGTYAYDSYGSTCGEDLTK